MVLLVRLYIVLSNQNAPCSNISKGDVELQDHVVAAVPDENK
jgi:hypothetical protein